MKDTKKRRLNVISSTFFTIVGLLACFTGTMAWFTSVRLDKSDANEFVVSSGNLPFSRVDIFQQDLDHANDDNPYRFSSTSSGYYTSSTTNGQPVMAFNNNESVSNDLQEYDSLNYSFNQCILFLFTVDGNILSTDPDSIYIGAKMDDVAKCLFVAKADSSEPENALQSTDNPLSNVINFKVVPLTSTLTVTDSYYDLTSSVMSTTSSSFIYSNKETDFNNHGLLNDSSTLKSSLSLYSNTAAATDLVQVAVIVSYDDFLINNLYTINLGSDVLNSSVGFSPDWRFVI